MDTLTRSPRSGDRDDARSRVRGRRRFHPVEAENDAGQPPSGEDLDTWPGPERPAGPDDNHIQWPYWIVLLVPWLTLTAAFVLEHFQVCLICLGNSVPVPGGL
jgi:hypothetical protein